MKELIFPEYKNNKFIDGIIVHVNDDNYKYNIIWGRDFNTWCIITKKKNLCVEATRDMIDMNMIYVMIYITHA